MPDQAQLAAWTRLKVHLHETMQLLERTKEKVEEQGDKPELVEDITLTVADIGDNMDVVEQVFICL